MGLLDDATSKLDALTAGGSSSTATATANFVPKEILSKPEAGEAGYVGTSYAGQTDKPNPLDGGITTEFIHFGDVHPDTGKKFVHGSYSPEEAKIAPDGHGIMFRDALEREAITLFGFVSSTRVILKEVTESGGMLGAVGDLASAAFGGGSGASKPDPTQLDTFLSDIQSVIDTINKPAILYLEIHEAGKKLHETRATYVAFCKTLNDFYIKPPEGSPLDVAAGAIANVPGVGNIMATVQRFAFKMQEMYLAAYLQLRLTHEKPIETSAHDLTITAIKADYKDFAYTYPIWFKKPDSQKVKDKNNPPTNKFDEVKKDVTDKVDEVKKDVTDKVDKVYDFLGMNGAPEKTPGTKALSEIFGKLKGPTETTPDALPSASNCLITGIDTAMQDIHGIPEFVKKVMTRLNDANLDLLEEIFARMMARSIDGFSEPEQSELKQKEDKVKQEVSELKNITDEERQKRLDEGLKKVEAEALGASLTGMMLAAARHSLPKTFFAVMNDLVGGVIPLNFSMDAPGGKKLDAQQFAAKIVEDKLMPFVNPIIEYMVGDLSGNVAASCQKAKENKAQTMEVLLGRLPWLTSLMFKNTFFPMWNLVIEKVFENINPQIAKVVSAVNSVFETAKNAADTASDYSNRAGAVKDKAASGVNSLSDLGDIRDSANNESLEAKKRREDREKAQKEKDRLDAFYKPNDKDEKFPVTSRVADGEGKKVEEDVESVIPDTPPAADQTANEQPANQPPASGIPAGVMP